MARGATRLGPMRRRSAPQSARKGLVVAERAVWVVENAAGRPLKAALTERGAVPWDKANGNKRVRYVPESTSAPSRQDVTGIDSQQRNDVYEELRDAVASHDGEDIDPAEVSRRVFGLLKEHEAMRLLLQLAGDPDWHVYIIGETWYACETAGPLHSAESAVGLASQLKLIPEGDDND